FCLHTMDDEGYLRADSFCFTTVQVSHFLDGPKLLVWCNCWSKSDLDSVLRGEDFKNFNSKDFFQGSQPIQRCMHGDCAVELFCNMRNPEEVIADMACLDISGTLRNPEEVIADMACLDISGTPSHQYFKTRLLYKWKQTPCYPQESPMGSCCARCSW